MTQDPKTPLRHDRLTIACPSAEVTSPCQGGEPTAQSVAELVLTELDAITPSPRYLS